MPKQTGQRVIFSTKLLTLKDVDLEFNTGKRATYQILEKRDTALIVPVTDDGQLILIREYFTAIDEYQLALPKGRIEETEQPLLTANKELQEEIGYKAGTLVKLGILTMSPGYLTQKTHVYLARDLQENKLEGDEAEALEIVQVPFSQFENLIDQGKLTEARMIAALYLAKRFLQL